VSNLVRILLAIFLPPVAVLMTNGIGLQFLLNILLTIFFVLPGTIHALWLVLRAETMIAFRLAGVPRTGPRRDGIVRLR
jgi:uncharacterized membrane protein YqaE (UPF0057 family)